MPGVGKVVNLLGKPIGALGDILDKKISGGKSAFKIEDPDSTFPTYDFTQSAPKGSDQIKGFMSAVDMIHVPTGTRIPANNIIRGHEPDFELAPGIPKLDDPEVARRLLMGEITVDEARKIMVEKNTKVVK